MNKWLFYFVVFGFLALQTSCDPAYHVDYEIDNSSPYRMEINYRDVYSDSLISNTISGGTRLIFYNEFGIGYCTERYMERLNELPVSDFEIVVLDTVELSFDEQDIERWVKFFPDRNSDIGSIKLQLNSASFR